MIKNDQTGQVTDPRIQSSPIVGFALSSKHYSDKRMAISLCIVPELENVMFKLKDTIGMKIDTWSRRNKKAQFRAFFFNLG